MVLVGDGLNVARKNRKMPVVKRLHHRSANNFQSHVASSDIPITHWGLRVRGALEYLCCVPLSGRIHGGFLFSNLDRHILLNNFMQLLLSLAGTLVGRPPFVVDAYCASAKVISPPLAKQHQVLTHPKCNAVARHPAAQPRIPRRGPLREAEIRT